MNLLEFASQYVEAGLSCVPAKDKHPFKKWKSYQSVLPDVSALADDYLDAAQLYIICGHVSGNFEVIDIDVKHDPEKKIFIRYKELIQSVNQGLFDRLLIERSPTQGYHLCYRCAVIGRNQKLAYTPDNEVLIETRAEGGGIVCAPSPGYILVRGSFSDIPEITPQERDFLFNAARVLSQKKEDPVFQSKTESTRSGAGSACDDFDQTADILYWLQQHGWQITAKKGEVYWLKRPGDSDNAHSATWNFIPGRFWCWSTSTAFENEKLYKPYAVFAVLECGSDFKEAARRLYEMGYGEKREFKSESAGQETKAQTEPVQTQAPDHEYFRVGINYFKKIQVTDIHGNQIEKIIKWSKDELILDYGKKFVFGLPKYDSFIVRPSHLDFQPTIGRSYNLYGKVSHEVIGGDHPCTTAFIKHIFGDKETIFLDYLTILWQKPTQILPVICLVSEKRQTGKTTMLKWLRALFQNNAAILKNENFQTAFNAHYVGKLLIMIDENYVDIEKKKESERIKSMATADTEWLQFKGKDSEQVDYFGKIFMTANNKEFIKIDKEEIRYMVVEVPAYEKNDPLLLEKMIGEIPAFLYMLTERRIHHPREDRAWFRPDLLESKTLTEVVENTKHQYELLIDSFIDDCFDAFDEEFTGLETIELKMTATDIYNELKDKYRFLDLTKVQRYLKMNGYRAGEQERYTFYSLVQYRTYDPGVLDGMPYRSKRNGKPCTFTRARRKKV